MDDGGSLALAMNADGGLALSLRDGALTARPLSADGSARGPEATSSLAGAQALLALAPRGDRYLLIARGSCDESAHCLIARLLDAAGAPAGAPTRVALPDPIRTSRRAGEGALLFAWSTTSGHRALERFTALPDGAVSHVRIALGDEPATSEQPVEILGLAADGERFAVVWRRGPTEDTRSEVYVTSGAGEEVAHRDVHALHHVLAIDAIELQGNALTSIVTFEFSRPHLIRLDLPKGEPTVARELPRGARAPEPFAERERAELDVDSRGLWLRRRDAAGDPVGTRVHVAEGRVESAALARAGDALFVAWTAGGTVSGRRIICP